MSPDAAALRMQMRSALLLRSWLEKPAQFGLQHLAVIVLGQRLDKPVGARPLNAGDVVEAEPVEFPARDRRTLARDEKGDDLLPQSGYGRPTTDASKTSGWRSSTSFISRG